MNSFTKRLCPAVLQAFIFKIYPCHLKAGNIEKYFSITDHFLPLLYIPRMTPWSGIPMTSKTCSFFNTLRAGRGKLHRLEDTI